MVLNFSTSQTLDTGRNTPNQSPINHLLEGSKGSHIKFKCTQENQSVHITYITAV